MSVCWPALATSNDSSETFPLRTRSLWQAAQLPRTTACAASIVEVHIQKALNARSHFDAHSYMELVEGDVLTVRRCRHDVRLLHPVGHNYYHTLREKLHWSEAL